jgi:enamine deaminase RidA (YjgF/YER057c/UK114 family)
MSINALKAVVQEGAPVAVQPADWPKPKGYSNGMQGKGTLLMTGGLVGWNKAGEFPAGLVAQTRQTLENIVAVLEAGGARAEHLMRMTWYVTSIEDYSASLREIGQAYREVIGRHFPAMALVQVVRLVEPMALIEIEATAIIPD